MFIRLHKLPRRFYRYCNSIWELTPRAKYIKDQSYKRYVLTEDGNYIPSLKNLEPEIGRIENIRFVTSTTQKL